MVVGSSVDRIAAVTSPLSALTAAQARLARLISPAARRNHSLTGFPALFSNAALMAGATIVEPPSNPVISRRGAVRFRLLGGRSSAVEGRSAEGRRLVDSF